jgi:hypothetical protein
LYLLYVRCEYSERLGSFRHAAISRPDRRIWIKSYGREQVGINVPDAYAVKMVALDEFENFGICCDLHLRKPGQ